MSVAGFDMLRREEKEKEKEKERGLSQVFMCKNEHRYPLQRLVIQSLFLMS